MLNYEGEMPPLERRQDNYMEDNTLNEIFELVSVLVSDWDWDATVHANISSCFLSEDADHSSNMNDDSDFSVASSSQAEISKFGVSISSTKSSENECPLFGGPFTSSINSLEDSLSSILAPDDISEVISTLTANKSKGVSPDHLSKIWLVKGMLAKGAFEKNTQLNW